MDDETLTIAAVPDKFTLEIVTEIAPAKNTALEGLYLAKGIFCTQCEAEGFRRITYFLDRPDVLAVYTTRIEARQGDAAGAAVERQSDRKRRACRAGGISRCGTIRSPSPAICSRWWPAIWA